MSNRKIVVDGREWKYKIGRQHVVANAVDNNEKQLVDFSALMGYSWDEIDSMRRRHGLHITPKTIADWLRSKS